MTKENKTELEEAVEATDWLIIEQYYHHISSKDAGHLKTLIHHAQKQQEIERMLEVAVEALETMRHEWAGLSDEAVIGIIRQTLKQIEEIRGGGDE